MAKFSTVIDGTGSRGNVMDIIGTARVLMRKIGVSPEDISDLTKRSMNAPSYKDAVNVVREWFPVELDEDE
jgi:hypothetical protein